MKYSPRIKLLEELIVLALFGAMMFVSAQVDLIPNVHPLAMFIVSITLVYRTKALISIYVYVFLEGLIAGFSPWWVPYLYVWTLLWAMAMLIPRRINELWAGILAIAVSFLHGAMFGILYAPVQCYLVYGGDWAQTVTWMLAGALFDAFHAVGNLASSLFVIPLSRLIFKLSGREYPFKPMIRRKNK